MIKLTEIYQGPVEYDEKSGENISLFGLREIYVNPKYVVCIKEDECLQSKSKNGSLIEGLHSDMSYTQVTIHGLGQYSTNVAVLGTRDQIAERLAINDGW